MPRHQSLIPHLGHSPYSISKVYGRWSNWLIGLSKRDGIPELVRMSLALPQAAAMIEPLNLSPSLTL